MTYRKLVSSGVVSLCALLAGCESSPERIGDPPEGDVPVHLFVSNQSFDIDSVQLTISIDGVPVVSGDFDVEDQHEEYTFDFLVQPGVHTIHVESESVDVTLDRQFTAAAETWALLDFVYYAEVEGGAGPTPEQFIFQAGDTAPAFD